MACLGVHNDGVIQPSVPFMKRKVCSMSKRRRYAHQARSRSASPGPDHNSQSVFFVRDVGLGRCPTSTPITLARTMGMVS